MIPGEYILAKEPIKYNEGREAIELRVVNNGDRPIQVGSHFHFYEVNEGLEFDREKAYDMVINNEICDSKTVIGLLLAKELI